MSTAWDEVSCAKLKCNPVEFNIELKIGNSLLIVVVLAVSVIAESIFVVKSVGLVTIKAVGTLWDWLIVVVSVVSEMIYVLLLTVETIFEVEVVVWVAVDMNVEIKLMLVVS